MLFSVMFPFTQRIALRRGLKDIRGFQKGRQFSETYPHTFQVDAVGDDMVVWKRCQTRKALRGSDAVASLGLADSAATNGKNMFHSVAAKFGNVPLTRMVC